MSVQIEDHITFLMKNPGKWRLIRKRRSRKEESRHRAAREKAYNQIKDMLTLMGVEYVCTPRSLKIKVLP